MIPVDFITEWREEAPWIQNAQVEQDLVISRALVDIFSVEELAARLAFRGGTALYKLFLRPAARYSEDIDLVQVPAEPIGTTLDLLKRSLNPWLGEPMRAQRKDGVRLVYRFRSEDSPPLKMRLKIEVNTREHFTELGLTGSPFSIQSRWFSGASTISTYMLEELLATKLRALYQRRKGRDLFDLWYALENTEADLDLMLQCFHSYMRKGAQNVNRQRFQENLIEKANNADFRRDMDLLLRPGLSWDFDLALGRVRAEIVDRLPG